MTRFRIPRFRRHKGGHGSRVDAGRALSDVALVSVVRAGADTTEATTVCAFTIACERAIESRPPVIVIDLTDVVAADTKIVAGLVAALRMARRAHVEVEVRLSDAVLDVLELCHLHSLR